MYVCVCLYVCLRMYGRVCVCALMDVCSGFYRVYSHFASVYSCFNWVYSGCKWVYSSSLYTTPILTKRLELGCTWLVLEILVTTNQLSLLIQMDEVSTRNNVIQCNGHLRK